MPGLATHVLAAYLVKNAAGIRPLALFLLGTILPDILSRVPFFVIPGLFWAVKALHSVFVIVLACLLLSYLFPERGRRQAFKILLAGALLHIFLDLFQLSIYPGYMWFFPFSTYAFNLGLFWPEEPLFALPFLALVSLAVYLRTRRRKAL
jgi:membrane-bound metal-dependent hydrolase YbcI (DUF457 family)